MSCYFYFVVLDLSCGECDVISLCVLCCSVNGSVCILCCIFVNCLVKQFGNMFGCGCY